MESSAAKLLRERNNVRNVYGSGQIGMKKVVLGNLGINLNRDVYVH